MPEMKLSPLTKVELDNAIDVILMLYEWDLKIEESERHINSLLEKNRACLESIPS